MSTSRRPTPAATNRALPTLAALTLSGVLVQSCVGEAYAQTVPDAGVRPPHPPSPPRGGIRPVHPQPPPPPPPPPLPPPDGGMARVQVMPLRQG